MNEEVKKLKEDLEKELKALEESLTPEMFEQATEEEIKKYIELMTEVKLKLEILNAM